jgi:LPXTG-site transpeptidase (sortase) family protein
VRPVLRWTLTVAGVLLIALSVGIVGFAQWSEWQHKGDEAFAPRDTLAETLPVAVFESSLQGSSLTVEAVLPPIVEIVEPEVTETAQVESSGTTESTESTEATVEEPAEEPEPVPQRPATFGKPSWMRIPRINVNSGVVASVVSGGVYTVPSWRIGHHYNSANPGDFGNSVYTAHVESIDGGRIFGRLRELKPGDAIYTYTDAYRLDWVVQEIRTVPNTDGRFIAPTQDMRITVYTCTGTWNPRTQDYSHRLVVTGYLANWGPRE